MKNYVKHSILSTVALLLGTQISFAQRDTNEAVENVRAKFKKIQITAKQIPVQSLAIETLYKDAHRNYFLVLRPESQLMEARYFYGDGQDFYQLSGQVEPEKFVFPYLFQSASGNLNFNDATFKFGTENAISTLECASAEPLKFWRVEHGALEDNLKAGQVRLHPLPIEGHFQEFAATAETDRRMVRIYFPSFDVTPLVADNIRVFAGQINQLMEVAVKSSFVSDKDGSAIYYFTDGTSFRIPSEGKKIGNVVWIDAKGDTIIYKTPAALGMPVTRPGFWPVAYPFQNKTPCELVLKKDGTPKAVKEAVAATKK